MSPSNLTHRFTFCSSLYVPVLCTMLDSVLEYIVDLTALFLRSFLWIYTAVPRRSKDI